MWSRTLDLRQALTALADALDVRTAPWAADRVRTEIAHLPDPLRAALVRVLRTEAGHVRRGRLADPDVCLRGFFFRVDRCRSCGARIIWALTLAGKRMPLDADPVADGTIGIHPETGTTMHPGTIPGFGGLTSHFATCPDAAAHRGKTRGAS